MIGTFLSSMNAGSPFVARRPTRSLLPLAAFPSISEIPFPRFLIQNISVTFVCFAGEIEDCFGEAAETRTRAACAPQSVGFVSIGGWMFLRMSAFEPARGRGGLRIRS